MKIQGPWLSTWVVSGGRRDRKEATVSDNWRPAELPSYMLYSFLGAAADLEDLAIAVAAMTDSSLWWLDQ